VQLRLVRYLTYVLAACVILSDGLYLFYLNSGQHMLRYWSGMNSALLGLFMVSWAVLMRAKGVPLGRCGDLGNWSSERGGGFIVLSVKFAQQRNRADRSTARCACCCPAAHRVRWASAFWNLK
jgi:hypothetical protein